MKITIADLHFWQAHHRPGWTKYLELQPIKPRYLDPGAQPLSPVHACINARARSSGAQWRGDDAEHVAATLLVILRSMRKRHCDLLIELTRMANDPGTITAPAKRAKLCRKWAQRIMAARLARAAESARDELLRLSVQCNHRPE